MSGHGDPHEEAHGEDEHAHDDHHAPPPLPEPPTPLWLTLLGIGLFLVAGILFIATRSDGKTTAELTAVPSAEAPSPAPAAPAPAPAPNPAAAPSPSPAGRLNLPSNPSLLPKPAVRP